MRIVAGLGNFLAVPRRITAAARFHRHATQTSGGDQGGDQQQDHSEMSKCTKHGCDVAFAITVPQRSPHFSTVTRRAVGVMAQAWVILRARMPRGRFQLVVLAVLLLFANCWCVAQCIVTPVPGHLPPCHRQHQTVKLCASTVGVEAETLSFTPPIVAVALVALPGDPSISAAPADLPDRDISPPPPLVSTPILA